MAASLLLQGLCSAAALQRLRCGSGPYQAHGNGGCRTAEPPLRLMNRTAPFNPPHRTAPYRTVPHSTAPHRTIHRTASHRTAGGSADWATMTISTVGYGDIVPVTDGERLFVIGGLCVGATFFSYVVGTFCTVVAKLGEKENIHQARSAARAERQRLLEE